MGTVTVRKQSNLIGKQLPEGDRTTGRQDHRKTGPQEDRTTGRQDHRTTGLQTPLTIQ